MGRTAVAVLSALALLPAAPAHARDFQKSRHLWATVNVCDTERNPDTLGIRASMPGSGRKETLSMRFRVQLRDPATGRWSFIPEGADSGRREAGTVVNRRVELGHDFRFQPPAAGTAYTLRGHVTFYWRRGKRTVRRVSEVTVGGHPSTKGADPPGYSAPGCTLR